LLANGDADAIQHAWIALLAKAGEVMSDDHVKVWLVVCDDVLRQLQQDYLDAAEVLVLTVMFCLLFHRLKGRFRQSLQIQSLRSKVLPHFPDEAELTQKGIQTYKKILPCHGDDELLAHKILVGLTSLWAESKFEDSRMSLEYLSRRKLVMELPGEFPYELQDDDLIWFLWGALKCYYKEHDHINRFYNLFVWDWKRSARTERLGLLWGAAWSMHPSAYNTIYWSDKEMHFIETIQRQASKLWLDYINLHSQANQKNITPPPPKVEHAPFDFTPRVSHEHVSHRLLHGHYEENSIVDEKRTIEICSERRKLNPI
jgi:hypothetical protein